MNRNFKVYVIHGYSFMGSLVITEGGTNYLTKGMTFSPMPPEGHPMPDDALMLPLYPGMAEAIVEALSKDGIKAPDKHYLEGKVEAMTEHLSDLRALMKVRRAHGIQS